MSAESYEAVAQLTADPADWDRAAESWLYYAECDLALAEGRARERRKSLEAAIADADAGLGHRGPNYHRMLAEGRTADAVAAVPAAGASALQIRAEALLHFAEETGFAAVVSLAQEVRTFAERALALDPNAGGAGADRVLGAFYSVAPAHQGRDLTRSRLHFERARERSPDEPRNPLELARYLAVAGGDAALFRTTLTPLVEDPGDSPEATCASARAAQLLAQQSRLFPDAPRAVP